MNGVKDLLRKDERLSQCVGVKKVAQMFPKVA